RAFLLIDPKHGAKDSDVVLLQILGKMGVPYQLVLSKCDRVQDGRTEDGRVGDGLKRAFEKARELMLKWGGNSGLGEIVATAANPCDGAKGRKGVNDLRWAILVAAGLEGKTR